jgi:hypothetical protein
VAWRGPLRRLVRGLRRSLGLPAIAAARPGSAQAGLPLLQPAAQARPGTRLVFLCGVHRSGKSLTEAHLHAHLPLARLQAPVPDNEGQHLQDVYPGAYWNGGAGGFALSPVLRLGVPGPGQAARLGDRLLRHWTPWIADTEGDLIEKSPPNLLNIPWLRALFPGARFVIVTRDPRRVLAETRGRSRASDLEILTNWHAGYALALTAFDPADCLVLRFEDLCTDPAAQIARVGTFLDLPARPAPLPLPPGQARLRPPAPAPVLNGIAPFPGAWDAFGYALDRADRAPLPAQFNPASHPAADLP